MDEFYSGIHLGSLLAKNGVDLGDYIQWLGTDERDSLLSRFNVERYEKYLDDLSNLKDGFYWIETDPDDWTIGYWNNEVFTTFGQELPMDEVISVEPTPIRREKDEEND